MTKAKGMMLGSNALADLRDVWERVDLFMKYCCLQK